MKQNTLSKQTAKFIATIAQNLPELSGQEMQSWINKPKKLQEALTKIFGQAKETVKKAVDGLFRLLVNYDLKVEALIKAGKYDWVDDDINTKNFPTKRTGQEKVELKLFHFNKTTTSKEVEEEMDEQGYRPAELHELLTFGANYPEEQRKYPIVALGSVWLDPRGSRLVPYLYEDSSKRKLNLNYCGSDWREYCRFAAVSK